MCKLHARHRLIVGEHRLFSGIEKKSSKYDLVKKNNHFFLESVSLAEEIIGRIVLLNLPFLSQGMV